jgi:hypothetical protein
LPANGGRFRTIQKMSGGAAEQSPVKIIQHAATLACSPLQRYDIARAIAGPPRPANSQ